MKKTILSWKIFGASVRGPDHRSRGMPNQDAWLGRTYAGGALIAVSDGMGSRPHAALGSKAACRAVAEACRLWSRGTDASVEWFLRLIHDIWHMTVAPLGAADCAATCLFALANTEGHLLMAQLGDGLAMLKQPTGAITILSARGQNRFANETEALGAVKSLKSWRWHHELDVPGGTMVLLATDGVADDLVQDKLPAFVDFVRQEYGALPPPQRWRRLARDLRLWPTPRHADDKTVAMMWTD